MVSKVMAFKDFLKIFPKIDLPVVLGEETHHIFSRTNDPLPIQAVQQYILPHESELTDEFEEFIACFQLPQGEKYRAVVYWKAALLSYEYHLMTFDQNGNFLDKQVIAGTFADGDTLTVSVATITETGDIIMASGQKKETQKEYQATDSTAQKLSIQPDGRIATII